MPNIQSNVKYDNYKISMDPLPIFEDLKKMHEKFATIIKDFDTCIHDFKCILIQNSLGCYMCMSHLYTYLLPDFISLSQCLADNLAEQLWPGILHTYLISESS